MTSTGPDYGEDEHGGFEESLGLGSLGSLSFEDDENVYHYGQGQGGHGQEWVPPPPSEASASVITTAPLRNRRAQKDREKWKNVSGPTLDFAGKPTALWQDYRQIKAKAPSNNNFIIAGIDCVALVKRLRNCWILPDNKIVQTDSVKPLAQQLAYADRAIENPLRWLNAIVQQQHGFVAQDLYSTLQEWEKKWHQAEAGEKEGAANRIKNISLAIHRALAAESAFERIERAEDVIADAMRKEGIAPTEQEANGLTQGDSNSSSQLVAHAATRLQATWRGWKSRAVITELQQKELLDLESALAADREAFRNRDASKLQKIARQRATEKYEVLHRTRDLENANAAGRSPTSSGSRSLHANLPPGLESARLCATPEMGTMQQEMGPAFQIYITKLWRICSAIRAQVTQADSLKTILDLEAELRSLASFGSDGRVSRDDLDSFFVQHAPKISAHERELFLTYLDREVCGLIPVHRVANVLRGALSDRRHLLCNWVFEKLYFETTENAYGANNTRLNNLIEFYKQFAPSKVREGKPQQVHRRYKDCERVNKDLFHKLYAKHAPWLSPPTHLWSRAAQRALIERRCLVPINNVIDIYHEILMSDQQNGQPLQLRVLNALRHAVANLEGARESISQNKTRIAQITIDRSDWLSFHAELSAGISNDEDFESVICRVARLSVDSWRAFAEKRARRDLTLRDQWALDRILRDSEASKMDKLRESLSARVFEEYERDLYEVLRKVRSSLLRVCGTDRTLENLALEFEEAPSFGDDRKLSHRDFRGALTRYGIILTREETQTLLVHYDTANSGHISVDAFFFGIRAAHANKNARMRVANENQTTKDLAKRKKKWMKAMRKTVVPDHEKFWVRYEDEQHKPYWYCQITGERTWQKPSRFERHDKAKWEAETKKRALWAQQVLKRYYIQANAVLDAQLEIVRTLVQQAMPLEACRLSRLPQSIFANPSMKKLTHLSLDRNSLDELPRAVLDLRSLQFLSLCHNNLTGLRGADLRAADSCFTNLITLRVSHNRLQKIPKALAAIGTLQELMMDHNEIATIAPDAFAGPEMRVIDLSFNRIRDLPENDPNWTTMSSSLVSLNLRNNQLSTMPRALGESLTALIHLDIADNRIDSLPDSFGTGLISMQTLHLEGNNLLKLPSGIGKAQALETLTLQHNALAELPDTICSLTTLRELRVNNNRLTALPDRLGDLSALESLKLQCNRLTRLPANFSNLPSLTQCWLHQNDIESLPSGVPTALRHWKLHNNRIRELPNSIGEQGGQLEHLDLAGNVIQKLPQSFYRLRALRFLRLDGNPLEEKLAEVVESGKYRTHDEENYGILLRKLIDGLKTYDLENRMDTALGTTVAQAMRESAYELQEKLQQAKEVALGVNAKRAAKLVQEREDEPPADKGAGAVGRGRSSTQQALARCLRRFSEKEGKDGREISKKGFQTCLQVVGNLLTPTEVARLTARVFVSFEREEDPDIICFDGFIDSLEHVTRVGNLREQQDRFALRNLQVARAVLRFCAAQNTRLATNAARRLVKSPRSSRPSGRRTSSDKSSSTSYVPTETSLQALHMRNQTLDSQIAQLQQKVDEAQKKARVVLEYERLEHQQQVFGNERGSSRPQSAHPQNQQKGPDPSRPASAHPQRSSPRRTNIGLEHDDGRGELWQDLRIKNRQVQELRRTLQQTQAMAHYYNEEIAQHVHEVESRRKKKIKKQNEGELSEADREARIALKEKRKKLRALFDRYAEPESLVPGAPNGASSHKRVISKGRMISTMGEFFRKIGNGRFDSSDSKDWQAKLLTTVEEAFNSGLRDAKTGDFVAYDRQGKGYLEWPEFLRLVTELERRVAATLEEKTKATIDGKSVNQTEPGKSLRTGLAQESRIPDESTHKGDSIHSGQEEQKQSNNGEHFVIHIEFVASVNRTHTLFLPGPQETIASLKSRIAFSEALPYADILLLYKGVRLTDQTTLLKAGIKPEAHLKLVLMPH